MAEEMICEDCGAPTGIRTIRYDENMQRVFDGIRCHPCLAKRNKIRLRERNPEAWTKAMAEYRASRAPRGPNGEKPAPVSQPEQDRIDAAVQRLMQEAARIEHAAPSPQSPYWIGRDLEREGWSRKVLVAAVAQALDDGDLVASKYRDGWGNRKRELRPAPTGVAVEITF